MNTDLRPVFSRKFCFCPEFRKAIHTQHFKLRIKLLLGRRVIDAEENRLSNYRLFENVDLQKRIRHLRVNVQLHFLFVLSCDIIKK